MEGTLGLGFPCWCSAGNEGTTCYLFEGTKAWVPSIVPYPSHQRSVSGNEKPQAPMTHTHFCLLETLTPGTLAETKSAGGLGPSQGSLAHGLGVSEPQNDEVPFGVPLEHGKKPQNKD